MSQRERLDVEDEETRSARLGNLFSSISQPPSEAPALPLPASRPHAVPESDVLARARAFLPLLAASNADLLARAAADPGSVSIENAEGGDVVAMDVGVGVFDVKGEVKGDMGPVVEREGRVWEEANEGTEGGSEESESDSESEESEESESGENAEDKDTSKAQPQPKVVEL